MGKVIDMAQLVIHLNRIYVNMPETEYMAAGGSCRNDAIL